MGRNLYLVAGLGNPGEKYSRTRHNIGFMVIDSLVGFCSCPLDKKKFNAVFGIGNLEEKEIMLAKPGAFMNNSGPPLFTLARYYNIDTEQMIIIHDDIDLAWGRIKIKTSGGHGGHKGVKSIMENFGTDSFTRIRIGIGHPGDQDQVVGHVLGGFTSRENPSVIQMLTMAQEAVVTVLQKGEKVAMNQFHGTWPEGI